MSMPEIAPTTASLLSDFDVPVPPSPRMTEEEFVAWCDEDIRAEWVNGKVIIMSPANDDHEDLFGWLLSVLRLFVRHRDAGIVRGGNTQVRFVSQRTRRIPDILFIDKSRREIVHRNHVEGPPDLLIEIVSPDSQSRDRREKFMEYQAGGVREYWIIDPMSENVEMYSLSAEGSYQVVQPSGQVISSVVLAGFTLETEWLWESNRPSEIDVLKRLGVI